MRAKRVARGRGKGEGLRDTLAHIGHLPCSCVLDFDSSGSSDSTDTISSSRAGGDTLTPRSPLPVSILLKRQRPSQASFNRREDARGIAYLSFLIW